MWCAIRAARGLHFTWSYDHKYQLLNENRPGGPSRTSFNLTHGRQPNSAGSINCTWYNFLVRGMLRDLRADPKNLSGSIIGVDLKNQVIRVQPRNK